jgi:hypothetical protein
LIVLQPLRWRQVARAVSCTKAYAESSIAHRASDPWQSLKQAATILPQFSRFTRAAPAAPEQRMVAMSKSNPVDRIRADAFEKARPELAEHAQAIRALAKRVLSDVLEIGERLVKARCWRLWSPRGGTRPRR